MSTTDAEQSTASISSKSKSSSPDDNLDFPELHPFPNNIATAPLLRISLSKLIQGDQNETDRLWKACCELGFFYLDLRGAQSFLLSTDGEGVLRSGDQHELTDNPWGDEADGHSNGNGDQAQAVHTNGSVSAGDESRQELDVGVDGDQLLSAADRLFEVGEQLFELPVMEKTRYDFADQGSYFGYKGYGKGVVDADGTKDRNEFYNVSKDDLLGISESLPCPSLLEDHKPLMSSYMRQSHAVVSIILRLLNARLDLPQETLPTLHRLNAASGDQLRWVRAPPQPQDDRRLSMGQHTDFGSVTILFNRLGGLQILPPGEGADWRYVKPLQGHAVVNLGDAMVKFSAGILRSNIHRVVNPPGDQANTTRMSLVYFSRPCDEVVLKALDGSKAIEERKASGFGQGEEVLTSKEWVLRRALGRRLGGDWNKSAGTEGGRA